MHVIAVLFIAILAPQAQEFEKARAEFKAAVAQMHEVNVRDAAQRVARSDHKDAVDVLLDGYGTTAAQIKMLWAEKVRWIREADANSNIEYETTDQGSRPTAGSTNKFLKLMEAQAKGKEVEQKIMRVEAVKREIVVALGGFKSDASVKQLATKLKADANWDRRAGICEALGIIDHAEAVPMIVEQLRTDKEAPVKVACIDALRTKKARAPEIVALICEQLKNEYWQVKYAAAIALKDAGGRDGIESLIDALGTADGRLKSEFNDVLVALTGVDKHGDHAAWKSWFDQNRDVVKAGTYQPKPEEKPGAVGDRGTTTFYGIPVKSKNVIFVLDCSASMLWESEWKAPTDGGGSAPTATGAGGGAAPEDKHGKPDSNKKIDILRWQLKRCMAQIPEGTEFNLITYGATVHLMSEKMLKMNESVRKQAIAFVDKIVAEGGTNTFDSLEKAFSMAADGAQNEKLDKKGADTIMLFSDGMPSAGQIQEPGAICAKIRDMNRTKKIIINTVGAFSSNPPAQLQANEKQEGEKFLSQLAQENGGAFVNTAVGDSKPKDDKK